MITARLVPRLRSRNSYSASGVGSCYSADAGDGSATPVVQVLAVPLRRNRAYLAVMWSQACTDFCGQLLIMAITWAALHQFGSARLGLVLAAWAVPRGVLL